MRTFPRGLPGSGLLLLRVILGALAAIQAALLLTGPTPLTLVATVMAALLLLSGVLLILGLLTRSAAVVTGIIVGLSFVWPQFTCSLFSAAQSAVLAETISVALVLLGPGAISIDSRLFGWHEVIIPPAKRAPGKFE